MSNCCHVRKLTQDKRQEKEGGGDDDDNDNGHDNNDDDDNDNDPNQDSHAAAAAATVSTFSSFFSDSTENDDVVLGWGIKGRGGVVANSIVVNDASGSLSLEAGPFLDDEDGGGSGFSESETDPFRLDASSSSERGGGRDQGTEEGG